MPVMAIVTDFTMNVPRMLRLRSIFADIICFGYRVGGPWTLELGGKCSNHM
jgi:hypothetical protein